MRKQNFTSSLISLILDMRFALISLFVCVIFIASATFIEKFYGSERAFDYIYHNAALYILFGILCLSFIAISIKFKFIKEKKYGAILIHYAFVIIILGAVTTHYTGKEGTIHLREGETSSIIIYKDGKSASLPYSITLNNFDVEYYEGNEFPLAYKSIVTINSGGDIFDATIAVNKILRIKGYRIYQLSYDEDMKGSTLLINNDFAGSLITYIGYGVLLLGFILSLFGKNSRIKTILKSISTKGNKCIIIIMLLSSSSVINATDLNIDENYLIPKEDAKKWESIFVFSNNGLIEPLECHARTILRKITHTNGDDSNRWGARLYMSFITYSQFWCNSPIIYCSDENITKEINENEENYLSFNDFFDNNGEYKLNHLYNKGFDLKELKKLDERVRIFSALIDCSLLKIFPTEEGKWVSVKENTFNGSDSIFVATSIYSYVKDKYSNSESNNIIEHIESFQAIKYKGKLPSSAKVNLSILYSKAPIFKIVSFGYITLGIILLFFVIRYANNITFMQHIKIGAVMGAIFAIFLLHSTGIALRWYISEQPPWSNTYETMVYVSWCMALGGLLFMKKSSIVCALASIMAAVTLFISSLNWLDPVVTPLIPVLNSPWLILHVTVITASYGFFGICAIIGLYSLLISFKRNSSNIVKELTLINELLMYIGLILVTIGTFIGAIWANLSWGRYWGWDAKESWALITIFVYTFVTHTRLVPKLKNDIIFSALSIFASLSVLMTYFGVNYYLSGLHSYGNNSTAPSLDIVIYIYSAIALLSITSVLKNRRKIKE